MSMIYILIKKILYRAVELKKIFSLHYSADFIRLKRMKLKKKIILLDTPTHGNLGDQAIVLAQHEFLNQELENVPVIDLTTATENYLAFLGDEPSKPLFVWPKDNTHLKYEGAVRMCSFVAEGLEKLGGQYAALLAQPEDADFQVKNGL